MRVKLTGGNQLILPNEVVLALDGSEYVDIEVRDGRLILSPLRQSNLDDVYEKIERLGITEADIADAVAWARRGGSPLETGT
jgi:virulence-associated protein VagC